ncbi:protein NYNRIN-like [Belonocnema kinseyi]|uniref:protein NYNRIN-like n=1 Tax=Belonocnema kinseyi TaxID=2817044 RepID=UPI00143D4919|nr:protein NYNRIN-like [Belonocnema kinseyi]
MCSLPTCENLSTYLVGPLPISNSARYVLTCVDRYSRWPEAFPIPDIEAATVGREFLSGWIARFGTPLRITTDQGRQFESQFVRELNNLLGTQHLRTTAYHPFSNGMVERSHRKLKESIKCHETEDWIEVLPIILLGIRSAWREDLKSTSAELVYGESIRLPGEFLTSRSEEVNTKDTSEIVNAMRRRFQSLRPVGGTRHSQKKIFVFKDLSTSEQVFVRHDQPKGSLQMPYDGPYLVNNRSEKFFNVNIKGKDTNVSIDRLKPAYIISEDESQLQERKQISNKRNKLTSDDPEIPAEYFYF